MMLFIRSNVFVLLLLRSASGFAQHSLTGKVQASDGQPLPFATVLLLNLKDSSLVKGAVANGEGVYAFEGVKPAYYFVTATTVGYQATYSSPFELTDKEATHSLAILSLVALEKQLDEVRIIANKPIFEQQLDKLVINPSAMITAAGGSVLDVLERSPSVRVDRQNGSISLGGRGGVMVMLNGKLSRLPMETVVQMLSGMNADNVETIELIANPSARYDAEGNAGLINIVLKRKQGEGTNGSFALMAGYGRYEKGMGSFSINQNQGRVNLFANVSYNHDHNWFDFLPVRTQAVNNELWENRQYSDRNAKNFNVDFKVGADVSLSKSTVLSAQIQGLHNNRHVTSYNTSNTRISGQNLPFTSIDLTWIEDNPWRNLGGSLGLSHISAHQHTLTIDLDYQYFTNGVLNTFEITRFASTNPSILPVKSINTSKDTRLRFGVFRADYARPLAKHWKMESGIKVSRSYIDNALAVERNTDGQFVSDPALTSKALFNETIGAAYFTISGKINPQTDIQGGLRAENTNTHIESASGELLLDRRYLNLFPSASIKHQLSKEHALNLSISRRITRPSYTELIPNFFLTDPTTYDVGNITLRPAYTNSIKTGYSFKETYLFWIGYAHERDLINRHQPVTYPGRSESVHITQNFDRADVLSVEVSFPLTLTTWWKIQNNVSGYYRSSKTQFDIGPFSQKIYYGNLNTVHTFSLGKRWTAELSALYLSLIPAGVMNLRSRTNVVAGVQKVLPRNTGTLRLTVNDLFWTNGLRWYSSFSSQQFDFQAEMKFEPRIVKLTYSRSFGNKGTKAARQRKGAEEERNRVTF